MRVGPEWSECQGPPLQKEIEAHEATHIPHAEWCEFCMAGLGRNKLHRKKSKKVQFCTGGSDEEEHEATGISNGLVAEGESSEGPVPRVCMD